MMTRGTERIPDRDAKIKRSAPSLLLRKTQRAYGSSSSDWLSIMLAARSDSLALHDLGFASTPGVDICLHIHVRNSSGCLDTR
jgi:hypothetical protein